MSLLCRWFGHKEKRHEQCEQMGLPCNHTWHWVDVNCARCHVHIRMEIDESTPHGVMTYEFVNMGPAPKELGKGVRCNDEQRYQTRY
jgi:cytochrome c peroxidase